MANPLGIVKQLRSGDDIDTFCGKCKENREHAIVSLKPTGEVERVQCRTCQSTHLFRDQKRPAPRARAGPRSAAPLPAETGPARGYSMQERFQVGDRIEHPKFGLGVVIEERLGKIDVRFGKEMRTLIHAS
jgi:hypothetical protein